MKLLALVPTSTLLNAIPFIDGLRLAPVATSSSNPMQSPMDEFADSFRKYCDASDFTYTQGTVDGPRGKPLYPYMKATCMNRRQRLVRQLAQSEGCEILIEVGAYLSAVAEIEDQWQRTKYHVIVDPSAPTCHVKNATGQGGALILEAPTLLGDFWKAGAIQQGLRALVQQRKMRMCLAWLGFAGTPLPSLGSTGKGGRKDGDRYGVLDVASAEAMRNLSIMSDIVMVEGPGSHCSPRKEERCPHASCGPEFMSYYFGSKFKDESWYAKTIQDYNSFEAPNASTRGYKNKWSSEANCLLRNASFPCAQLACSGDLPKGLEPKHKFGKFQVTREFFVVDNRRAERNVVDRD